MTVVTQNPSVILREEEHHIGLIVGDMPGSPDPGDRDDIFSGGLERRPVQPKRALKALLSSGAAMAVGHAVAEGCTGLSFVVHPTFKSADDPKNWPDDAQNQRDIVEVFTQTGYRGEEVMSIRDGLYNAEHDRFAVGWGGVTVHRELVPSTKSPVPKPVAIGQFTSAGAQFTKPDRTPTMVPVPVSTTDGRILWTEVPRFFRRILFQSSRGRRTWFKQYGDWRTMNARTGKYSSGVRRVPPKSLWEPGKYTPGRLQKDGSRAVEVMTWATRFPGVGPYGVSGWHAELSTVDSAKEHILLLLDYLKSGLHSVIIAAANRPFESQSASDAAQKIDELGRGRKGLASIITIELSPTDSRSGGGHSFTDQKSSDRGRLVLHEINTRLPEHLTDNTMGDALAMRIAQAERIPGLLIGRSDNYNFATAAAAWSTANRLRFSSHHRQKEEFLNRLLIEMGVTHWRVKTHAPEWDEGEPLAGVASIAGQHGGLSVNAAINMLGKVLDGDLKLIDEWWGDLPMSIVTRVLESDDPSELLVALGITGVDIPKKRSSVTEPVVETLSTLSAKLAQLTNNE
jgi:hypothetical protein